MATAPAQEQLKLLEVAELDKSIARLDRENEKHPLRQELGALINASAARARDREAAREHAGAARSRLADAEAASASLRDQISDKEAKLNSGVGLTSRDLLVLQEEIDGLRRKLDTASDVEFAALDEVERAEAEVQKLSREIDDVKDKVLEGRARLEDEVASIMAERSRIQAERDALLKNIYEKSRQSGGYAVIGMNATGQTGVGIPFSPVEVAQIKALPEDEIYFSEEYDCIVVRLPSP